MPMWVLSANWLPFFWRVNHHYISTIPTKIYITIGCAPLCTIFLGTNRYQSCSDCSVCWPRFRCSNFHRWTFHSRVSRTSGGALIWGDAEQLKLHKGSITWFPVAQAWPTFGPPGHGSWGRWFDLGEVELLRYFLVNCYISMENDYF